MSSLDEVEEAQLQRVRKENAAVLKNFAIASFGMLFPLQLCSSRWLLPTGLTDVIPAHAFTAIWAVAFFPPGLVLAGGGLPAAELEEQDLQGPSINFFFVLHARRNNDALVLRARLFTAIVQCDVTGFVRRLAAPSKLVTASHLLAAA